jgi:hypothetical protein
LKNKIPLDPIYTGKMVLALWMGIAKDYFPLGQNFTNSYWKFRESKGMNTRLRKNNTNKMPMFKNPTVLTLLTLLSCNVTKPVIVTKKAVPSSSKKVAPVLSKTNEVKPILKKEQNKLTRMVK